MAEFLRIQIRVIAALLLAALSSNLPADEALDFNRQVRPILADHCLHCHGPDYNQRQADLRLDVPDGVYEDRGGHRVIDRETPRNSELLKRIQSTDDDVKMPPPDAPSQPTLAEIATLRRWIESGAEWNAHWSFVPPKRVAIPQVEKSVWPHNEIDNFVLARLQRAALCSLLTGGGYGAEARAATRLTHFLAKAKRVIYLFQSGGPSQMDLFDYKPQMKKLFDVELPDSVRMGQRITTMTSRQNRFPVAPSMFDFRQHGESGAFISELLPHTAEIADDLCFVKSMETQAINHDPAITFFQTGSQLSGRPSMGSWFSYGLGSENANLPAFIAMTSQGSGLKNGQPLYDRLWGSGFLPTTHQGIKLRGSKDPVLYLNNPPGVSQSVKRAMLDDVLALNRKRLDLVGDPEIATRIAQYEMAFRMQSSIPELIDFSDEPQSVMDLYGPDVHQRGSYASNCLLARRLSERGVRFIQLFHRGWDQHSKLPEQIRGQCRDTDQPSAALIRDLKQRGLLDETLVVWGGEFGRTVYCQGNLSSNDYGRDHHPRCFTIWLAGGGIKPGMSWGTTDDFSYNIEANSVQVHDLHATMLHLLGIDHRRLTYRFQGRDHRLTDVHGQVVKALLA